MNQKSSCDLCGLAVSDSPVERTFQGKSLCFCCNGCSMVYQMLVEMTKAADPEAFRQTDLFKKCQALGVIPAASEDLSPKRGPSETVSPNSPKPNPKQFEPLTLTLDIADMWCPACAWLIETVLEKVPGITSARCLFALDRLEVRYDPMQTDPESIITLVEKLGYGARGPGEGEGKKQNRALFIRLGVSLALTANIMMLSFAVYSGFFTGLSREAVWMIGWPLGFLSGIVLLYGGRPIYLRALTGLSALAFGLETLITAGAFTTFFYSFVNLLAGSNHLYFDTASMLITLTLLGKTLEGKVKDRVRGSLGAFQALRMTKARVVSSTWPQGRWISLEGVTLGDILAVESGERVPADGVILKGSALVDESLLTGEPRPVRKKPGDFVTGGSGILSGWLHFNITALGKDSRLGRMLEDMDAGLGQKPTSEAYAERMLKGFVPAILLLALGTGLGGFLLDLTLEEAMIRAVTILVIACPCALGIAIPLVRVAGISVAGEKGILVRNFEAFENAKTVDTFILDKTGTVTSGAWQLSKVQSFNGLDEPSLVSLALGLEQDSDHDIAHAIRRYGLEKEFSEANLTQCRVFSEGISGLWNGKTARIGSARFTGIENEQKREGEVPAAGKHNLYSKVFLTLSGCMVGILTFGDELRKDAVFTLERLKAEGYNLHLVSGDGEDATRKVANHLGLESAQGDQSPQNKAAFVEALTRKGFHVAMVGDGVNDALAMTGAQLALAMVHKDHRGQESADVVFIHGRLSALLDFLDLARRVRRKIRQNFWFSFAYNLIALPLAVCGLLNPLIAVSAMLGSSLTVIGNTLFLLRKKDSYPRRDRS